MPLSKPDDKFKFMQACVGPVDPFTCLAEMSLSSRPTLKSSNLLKIFHFCAAAAAAAAAVAVPASPTLTVY